MKAVYDRHISELQYSFQFKNCCNPDYHYCFEVENENSHKKFEWLPAPLVSSSDPNKYKSFEEAVSDEKPKDVCRPAALSNKNEYDLPKIPFPMDVNRA